MENTAYKDAQDMKRAEEGIVKKVTSLPDDWGMFFPLHVIRDAWLEMQMTNTVPALQTVVERDPRYLHDVYLYDQIVRMYKG